MEGALFPFFKASKPLLGRSRTSLGFWPSSTSMPQTSPQSSLVQSLQERIDSLYKPEEYPACRDQAERWSRTKPLAGLTVLDATPVFDNTFTKYVALMRAGSKAGNKGAEAALAALETAKLMKEIRNMRGAEE